MVKGRVRCPWTVQRELEQLMHFYDHLSRVPPFFFVKLICPLTGYLMLVQLELKSSSFFFFFQSSFFFGCYSALYIVIIYMRLKSNDSLIFLWILIWFSLPPSFFCHLLIIVLFLLQTRCLFWSFRRSVAVNAYCSSTRNLWSSCYLLLGNVLVAQEMFWNWICFVVLPWLVYQISLWYNLSNCL